jgi:hypothetical protein
VLEKLLEVPTGEGRWRKGGRAVVDRWRHRAGSAHASAGSGLLIGDVHNVFKQGGIEGMASHGQRLGRTGYARVRARHAARRLPWCSGRVRPRDARPQSAGPEEGACGARTLRRRAQRGMARAWARGNATRHRVPALLVSVCPGLTAFNSKFLN